jgi:hypothetical protein
VSVAKFAGTTLIILGLIPTQFGLTYIGLGLFGLVSSIGQQTGFESGVGAAYSGLAIIFGVPALAVGLLQIWAGYRSAQGRGRLAGIFFGVAGALASLVGLRAAPDLFLVVALTPIAILASVLFPRNTVFLGPVPTAIEVGLWLAALLLYIFVAAVLVFRWKRPVIDDASAGLRVGP